MKIKALVSFAGTEASLAEGAEAEVSEDFAKSMVKAGYAEIVGAKAEPKAAPKKPAAKKAKGE